MALNGDDTRWKTVLEENSAQHTIRFAFWMPEPVDNFFSTLRLR